VRRQRRPIFSRSLLRYIMPEKQTIQRARRKAHEGKSPSTQAGEFVREEIHHIREGRHGARSARQAIAIGLSKARRAGVKLPPRGRKAAAGPSRRRPQNRPSARRSRAVESVLEHEPHRSASRKALSRQAHKSALRRGASSRRMAAAKAVRTKGRTVLRRAAQKAARTRRRKG
jgi:hypothetical protein